MKKLRLLLFEECNRTCAHCCNKNWVLSSLPICNDFAGYDVIILTGGEPMLRPLKIRDIVRLIRHETRAPIYLYTAKVDDTATSLNMLEIVDGMTVTLHDQSDVEPFKIFNDALTPKLKLKSLRLNLFEGIDLHGTEIGSWRVKQGIKWIKDCPLPQDEVFMRLSN